MDLQRRSRLDYTQLMFPNATTETSVPWMKGRTAGPLSQSSQSGVSLLKQHKPFWRWEASSHLKGLVPTLNLCLAGNRWTRQSTLVFQSVLTIWMSSFRILLFSVFHVVRLLLHLDSVSKSFQFRSHFTVHLDFSFEDFLQCTLHIMSHPQLTGFSLGCQETVLQRLLLP